MTGAMTYSLIAVGATSAVCLALISRAERARGHRSPPDGGSSYGPGISSVGDGWNLTSWFGSDHSGQSTDASGGWDSGGGDGGGGSDGGGGGSSD